MKIMIRRSASGLSVYVPKKDLEEFVVELQHEHLWGVWFLLKRRPPRSMRVSTVFPRTPIIRNAKVLSNQD